MSLSFIRSLVFSASGSGERNMGHAIILDQTAGFIYQFYQTPTSGRGGISKIRESDLTRIQELDFATGRASVGGGGAVLHKGSGYAYFATNNGRLKQLNLDGFTVGLDTFFGTASGEIVADSDGTYLYSVRASNSTAVRILATSLGLVSQVSVGSSLNPVAAQVDFARGNMYVGCNNTNTKLVKIRLSDFTATDITLPAGANSFHGSAYDTVNDRMYFIGATRIVRLNPANDSFSVVIPTSNAVGSNAGFIIACPNAVGGGVLYVGNGNANPPRVSEVSMATLDTTDSLTFTTPGAGGGGATGGTRNTLTGMLYVCTNGNPGQVAQFQGLADIPSAVPMSGGPNVKRRPYPYDSRIISNIY